MPDSCDHLCMFSRRPVAGEAKTRLIPALGPDGAAALPRRMTVRTLAAARYARKRPSFASVANPASKPGHHYAIVTTSRRCGLTRR